VSILFIRSEKPSPRTLRLRAPLPWDGFGCGWPGWEFCAFLWLDFSNLYQISRHLDGLQRGFTAHFGRSCGKMSQVPFNEQLTTFFLSCQSSSVKPGQTQSK
jgi:hypothetical protein